MWNAEINNLDGDRMQKFGLSRAGDRLSYAQVIANWQYDASFRKFFIGLLADAPFPAYFWETPAVNLASIDRPFEFVLVYSAQVAALSSNPRPFAKYFAASLKGESVVSFHNTGKDALLVAPCPDASMAAYASIATFSRNAPEAQQHALWQAAGAEMHQAVEQETIWLSTSGLGVAWLHLRLDQRPKYYNYAPYCQPIHRNNAWQF